jgi:hypothetical protein
MTDQALIDYYAKIASAPPTATAVEPASIPLPPSTTQSVNSDDEDDLFERVADVLTPPTSFEEDVKPLNKPLNPNGKRSRDASEDVDAAVEEDFGDFGDFGEVVPPKKIKLEVETPAVAASGGDESEEEEFEAVV